MSTDPFIRQEPGRAVTEADIIELHRYDSWVATRFGLKRRDYKAAKPHPMRLRFRLNVLDTNGKIMLHDFLQEQQIRYTILSDAEAKHPPA